MSIPDFQDLTGPLYVITRPRRHTKKQWLAAVNSSLLGEHGDEVKAAVRSILRRQGRTPPPEYQE